MLARKPQINMVYIQQVAEQWFPESFIWTALLEFQNWSDIFNASIAAL